MANETIRITRDGTLLATASVGADGRGIISLSASGWAQGSTQHLVVTAEDTAREMLESLPASGDVPVGPPGPIWQDLFDRADGALGNGWSDSIPAGTDAVANGEMVVSQGYGYYHVVSNAGAGDFPADLVCRITIPHSMAGRSLFGLAARIVGDGGVQFFLAGITWFASEGTLGPNTDHTVTITGGYPASWSVDQDHTLEIRVVGTRASLWADGQEYGYYTLASEGASGGAVGVIGDASTGTGWAVKDVSVYPV